MVIFSHLKGISNVALHMSPADSTIIARLHVKSVVPTQLRINCTVSVITVLDYILLSFTENQSAGVKYMG